MPNPKDTENERTDVPAGVHENGHTKTDSNSNMKKGDTTMTEPKKTPGGTGEGVKKKHDPKDPLRPRRKKARRACYACQRAHLTCGDERPCQRCVKRGLADQCQDGIRKKAKYLHDASPEALLPVLGPNFHASSASPRLEAHKPQENQEPNADGYLGGGGFNQMPATAATFPVYPQPGGGIPDGLRFPPQQTPVSPSYQAQRSDSIGAMGINHMPDPMGIGAIFDPSNPALFNYDIENLNFGSQYPAMEFGILGHMSSSADINSPQTHMMGAPASSANFPALFPNNNNNPNGHSNNQQFNGASSYDGSLRPDYAAAMDLSGQAFGLQSTLSHGLPHAYAVATRPGSVSLGSPSTDTTASPQNLFDVSPTGGPYANTAGAGQNTGTAATPTMAQHPLPPKTRSGVSKRAGDSQSLVPRRQRDSSYIYETVKEPYPYTTGFHNLISFCQKRFSAQKTLKIAKSLASIRPSFMACTRTLNRQDLIFMEKCFQRTLFQYEDFMQLCSAPTIVCRRTGEVAAVNKEFTALTGWTKDVLLGKAPNLNTNTGCSTTAGRAGANMHFKAMASETEGGKRRPQPVFLPELLDDDSAVEFYEDFAQLAFENSRGHVNRKCRLLKYRPPPQDVGGVGSAVPDGSGAQLKDGRGSILSGRVAKIDGEHGIQRIEKDGKVDCTYCWVIKRDVFDIPMLMVMNFLPCYYRNEEPNQLAV